MMRAFILVAILAITCITVGLLRGWFCAKNYTSNSSAEVTLPFDHEKFKKDKEEYQSKAESRLNDLDGQMEKLTAKGKDATGDARTQWEKDVAILKEKKEAARKQLGEIKDASAETWTEVRSRMDAALEDLANGFENAGSRFQ